MKEHVVRYAGLTAALERADYSGKTILVTGGGHGMGINMSESFAARKAANVVIVGRNESRIQASAAKLAEQFPETKFIPVAADISSQDDVKKLFASLDVAVDILINNAGYMPTPTKFQEADLDEWWSGYTINVFGTVNVTQNFLKHRAAKGASGTAVVITLNTIAAYEFDIPALTAYGSSKAALARLMELVAFDVPKDVARFISVHPGAVATDMGHRAGVIESLTVTEASLTGDFTAWLGSEEASFLDGRFVWVNWDVDELLARKQEILDNNMYKTALAGAETNPFK
ncbi:uncharacterized protein TRIVIDRAFT_46068 [Trichoderma virens Gv29-8]|uniref:Uncharacterized protein n=1 Tax=Hypocrea virens (strain Gv29-8 / FGSC 10586) TaxID=413071 RepID=G9MQB6_HYPVG|nr:uncharacterized protein TRIVIDRAFT_46068 [Trichoderma virens Gv29-8]EHK24038.1 hypothetical protein TRIVIDRAFT_46068 [Trichoderma virens Gv29-8]UKZ50350.1 hypothetical protein TrVGV298_004608 [Trichoderma virens]